jgi:hypothetical protein
MQINTKVLRDAAKEIKKSLDLKRVEGSVQTTFFFDARDGEVYMAAFGDGYRESKVGADDISFDVPSSVKIIE